MTDPDDPERWLGHVIHPPEGGGSFIGIQVESFTESYTVEQAKGIRDALDHAIAEADD